jgi:hypothetical protein
MLLTREKEIAILTEQEVNAAVELENRKRASQASQQEYEQKTEKKDASPKLEHREENIGLTDRQKNDLLGIKELLLNDRKTVDAMRLQEAEAKLDLIKSRLLIAKQQYDILKVILNKIKPLTKVSEADVAVALDEQDKKKQQSFAVKEEYRQQIEKLNREFKLKERELESFSKRFNIPLGTMVDEWSKEPKRTANAYMAFARVASLNDDLLLLKRKKELLEGQVALEEERLRNDFLRISVKDSFSKMANSKFATEEQVSSELKKYDISKADIQANLALYKEHQTTLNTILNSQKKALESIVNRKKAATVEKNTVFKDNPSDYENYVALLNEAELKVQEQIDIISKLNTIYSDIVSKITNSNLK